MIKNTTKFNKKNILIILAVIIIILIFLLLLFRTNVIKKESNISKKEETSEVNGVFYRILDNTEEDIKGILTFKYEDGIKNIEYDNDNGKKVKLDCNGRTKVVLDKSVKLNEVYNYTIVTNNGTKNEIIKVDQNTIDEYVKINKNETDSEYDMASVDFYNEEPVTKYYKIGNNTEEWIEYNEEFDISYIEYSDDNINTVTVFAKEVDEDGNTIINSKEISLEKKRKMDIFGYIIRKNLTLGDFGFSVSSRVNCENFYFQNYNLVAGHSTGTGNYSAVFKLDCSKIMNLNFEEMQIEIVYYQYDKSTVKTSVTFYYEDGENETIEPEVVEQLDSRRQLKRVVLSKQENKKIDYIEMNIWRTRWFGFRFICSY